MIQRTYVGLDVHARSIAAYAVDERTGELSKQRLPATTAAVLEWLGTLQPPLRVVYEAGPTGFGLARDLEAAGITCMVAAPSKIQRPPGDRVKTDMRDAEHLARLNLLDQITAIAVPDPAREAARDLVRTREDVRADLMRARHRLSKLLLRHGLLYPGTSNWTREHHAWLRRQHFEDPVLQAAFEDNLEAVEAIRDRRDRLDARLDALAETAPYAEVVHALTCLRGINTLTAIGLAVEIGDWTRFTGNSIGAYLGLVPSEHSSGSTRSQGSLTKAGNSHARRLLIEAAWHHMRPYRPGPALKARWDRADAASRTRADQGNRRLHAQWMKFEARKKRRAIAAVAIARELAGWCWSLAEPVQREHAMAA